MLTPTKATIAFSDGVEHVLSVTPGQSVLDAALEVDAPLLYQCRTGSCGTCLAQITAGDAEHYQGSTSSLLPFEREQGYRLLCLTEPRSETRFSVSYDSVAGTGRPTDSKCFVNAVEKVADDVVRLELELADGCWMEFRPGQFIQIKVPGTDVFRSYSIATTPADLPKLELFIRIIPGGIMSTWLTESAKADDIVEICGPFGQFFLKEKVRATHVLIAGGTGLAPMMAMIDTLRAQPGRKPKVILSFGCQTPDGLFNLDQLELRGHWMASLDARISVDRGSPADGIRVGNPVVAVKDTDGLTADTVAYLCGPPGMIEAARKHLEALGVSAENIFAEQFVASN